MLDRLDDLQQREGDQAVADHHSKDASALQLGDKVFDGQQAPRMEGIYYERDAARQRTPGNRWRAATQSACTSTIASNDACPEENGNKSTASSGIND